MRAGLRGRFVGLKMTRFHQPLRTVARFACIAALLCCCGFVPREKHAVQTQVNELEEVYVVGTLYKRGHNVVVVWENGVPKQLTDKKGYALAEAVSVCGDDVYVAGNVYDADRRHCKATVWKNGAAQVLETGEAENAYATSMVVSDGDVYVAGYVFPDRGSVGPKSMAAVWKNGVLTRLTDGSTIAHAEAVAVSGADVYVAGVVYGDTTMATLWKNGVPQALPDGEEVNVDAVAVSDGTVYVTGTALRDRTGTSVILWRNGMPIDLGNEWYPDGINVDGENVHNECFPDGISVDGADVYVTGWFLKYDYDKGADGHGVLWKDGEFREVSLLPEISYFLGPVMIVSDGHVYAAGQMDWRTAMVWKDGKTIPLPRPAGLTRHVPQFFDIFVK